MKPWTCDLCGQPLAHNVKCERLTGMCYDCMRTDPKEFEERWVKYVDESYETREANSR